MKHTVIFFDNEIQITTTPRDWARQNQVHFPTYDFTNNDTSRTPNTETVARYLIANHFRKIRLNNDILYIRA